MVFVSVFCGLRVFFVVGIVSLGFCTFLIFVTSLFILFYYYYYYMDGYCLEVFQHMTTCDAFSL